MFMAGSGFMDLALSNPYVPTSQTATPLAVSALENAKAYVDNTFVQVTGKIATTDYSCFPGFFYMEEPNRSSGIRVVVTSMSGTLAKGMTISLTGHMATTSAGEREIDSAAVTVSGAPALLGALGVTNESLGGGNLGTPASGLGQYGVSGGSGANNVGILVKVWGNVTSSGTGYIVIDDGSGVSVTVDTSEDPNVPTSGYVEVTGISSLYGTSGSATRLVLAID